LRGGGFMGEDEQKVFVRRVSGLVRELSILDAALYGVLATGTFITIYISGHLAVHYYQGLLSG